MLSSYDSIIYRIKNCHHKKYLETLRNNKKYFNKELGLMENEISQNINEVISLISKCYSIQTVDNEVRNKSKGISKNYSKKIILMNILKNFCLMKMKIKKAELYNITLKQGKLQTVLQLKDDIDNFNDKRHMIDNLISKPHEIN